MAHIEKRTTAKGVIRYRAQITLKGHPGSRAATITLVGDKVARGQSISGNANVSKHGQALPHDSGTRHGHCEQGVVWLGDNPCSKVARPTEPRGRVRFLDNDERLRLLAACEAS